MREIHAVIYDMDGVIIDSEPLWREAEIHCFQKYDIELNDDLCGETAGLRVDEVIDHWFTRHAGDMSKKEQLQHEIMDSMLTLVREKGKILTGVTDSLTYLKSKHVPTALASSSSKQLIDTVLDSLRLKDYFSVIYSAESESYGKPHPGVYITTAKKLGVAPIHCLAIEDTINGALAAKAAKMKCIAIPEKSNRDDPRFAIADTQIASLHDLHEAFERL